MLHDIDKAKNRKMLSHINDLECELREEERARRLLESEVNVLERKVETLAEDKQLDIELSRIIVAIQDLNSQKLWEKHHPELCDALYALRFSRVYACHYILVDDDPDYIRLKEGIVYEKLHNLSDACVRKLEEISATTGIVNSICSLFAPTPPAAGIISDFKTKLAEAWWE